MCEQREIQILRHRYDLRAAGAQVRDYMENMEDYAADSVARLRGLEAVSNKFRGKDRLFFRQGFLFRAGELS